MSDVITDTGDSFTRTAGRQLVLLGMGAIVALGALMWGLAVLSDLTGSGAAGQDAIDAGSATITLSMAGEPPSSTAPAPPTWSAVLSWAM
jgi:hypothetical protein